MRCPLYTDFCRSPATPTKSFEGASGSYSLSDPEVMARIGNRAIKTVQKSNSEYSFRRFSCSVIVQLDLTIPQSRDIIHSYKY